MHRCIKYIPVCICIVQNMHRCIKHTTYLEQSRILVLYAAANTIHYNASLAILAQASALACFFSLIKNIARVFVGVLRIGDVIC
jgi:hypothetical protein